MSKKSKLFFLSCLVLAGSLSLPIASYSIANMGTIIYGNEGDPSCEKYWSDESYTSIYDLTQISSFSGNYTTWGTVTACYQNASGTMSAFIQSKDKNGNVAGGLLYAYGSTALTPNTTLIEITGTPTWWYGQLRFSSTCSYLVKSTSWYAPETNIITSSQWIDSKTNASSSDPLWQEGISFGARKTTIRNINVTSTTSNQAYATFNDSSKQVLFYYNDVSSSLKTVIYNKFNTFYGQNVDVTGYFQCYKGTSTNTMELQVCSADDIVEANLDPISVTGVNLNTTSSEVNLGSTLELTATVSPSNATNKNVSWSSSNSNIASVDNGTITPVQVGTADITVRTEDGNYSAVCHVTVTNNTIHVTSVSLSQNTLAIAKGSTANLTATVLPSNATNKNVSWSSDNTGVATVSNGTINALATGTATITATTIDGSFTDSCSITVEDETLSELSVDNTAGFSYGSYSTNFGTGSYGGIDYGFYRVSDDYTHSGMILLYSSTDNYDYNSLPGAFFNNTPINGIKKITVSYISTGGITVNYGVTKTRGYSQTLAATSSSAWSTATITCAVASCYFSVETNGENAYINSITIGYNSSLTTNVTTAETSDYRIAPTIYSSSLVDGVSSISVPNDITVVGNTYTVNSYKTYTYYSYSYVSANSGSLNLSNIAMIDPVDVANYYIAFHSIPANFGSGNTVNEDCGTLTQVKNLFGSSARSIKQYSLTTGYANAVSWNPSSGSSTPLYYEFDIALDSSYTTSNRGVGRVVMWIDGWSCYTGTNPIAVFTDDHYATFGEYLNYGYFGTRFDSQTSDDGYRTGYTNFEGSAELTQA
ncbi:MAG TPA: Ig-like domain-containing protein [Bacilli bacterium]|nr:Ig-like domain-containing protein [Bacilli bacterium]